jgi:hypothetical protein
MSNSRQDETAIAASPQTVNALLQDCHRLLNQVAKRPNAVKHLLYLHQAIGQFAEYKANRKNRLSRRNDKKADRP